MEGKELVLIYVPEKCFRTTTKLWTMFSFDASVTSLQATRGLVLLERGQQSSRIFGLRGLVVTDVSGQPIRGPTFKGQAVFILLGL